MIPKKIHYCWLSGEAMPQTVERCMESWKRQLPDYELVLWDMNRFDVHSVPYTEEACQVKQWAFAADYIRLYALYTEGGIYLDSDVFVCKNMDEFLRHGFFSSVEMSPAIIQSKIAHHFLNADGSLKNPERDRIFAGGIGLQAAVMGSTAGHPFLKRCLDWYGKRHYLQLDGTYCKDPIDGLYAPSIFADNLLEFGFRYKDELQNLQNDIVIYPNAYFPNTNFMLENPYAIHLCNGSWRASEGFNGRIKRLEELKASHSKIWIYGAGRLGVSAALLLNFVNIEIEGFIVSDGQATGTKINKPILQLKDMPVQKDTGVVVALNSNHLNEAWPALSKRGFDLHFYY
jgi:hypothetical protein